MKNIIIPALVALALAGCVTAIPYDAPVTHPASEIAPKAYDGSIQAYFREVLRDYGSAQIEEVTPPKKVRFRQYGISGWNQLTTHEEWLVCYRVNAKNAYGAFTGWETYPIFVRDDGAFAPPSMATTLESGIPIDFLNDC